MQSGERGRLRYAVNPSMSDDEQEESDKASHDEEYEEAPARGRYLCQHAARAADITEMELWVALQPTACIHRQEAGSKLSYLATTRSMGLAIPSPKTFASFLGSTFSITFGITLMTMKQRTNCISPERNSLHQSAEQCPNFTQRNRKKIGSFIRWIK